MQAKILLVDDDRIFLSTCKTYLEHNSFQVAVAQDGPTGLAMLDAFEPDITILDVHFEGRPLDDGLEVCREMRRRSGQMKIIMISGIRVEEADKVAGLEGGAIVYLIKPVEPRTLLAQVKALLREPDKVEPSTSRFFICGSLRIHVKGYVVERWVDHPVSSFQPISLGRQGFEILKHLVEHQNEAVSRYDLAIRVWRSEEVSNNVIDKAVHDLRQKIEPDPRNPQYILAVPGVGYKLACPPA